MNKEKKKQCADLAEGLAKEIKDNRLPKGVDESVVISIIASGKGKDYDLQSSIAGQRSSLITVLVMMAEEEAGFRQILLKAADYIRTEEKKDNERFSAPKHIKEVLDKFFENLGGVPKDVCSCPNCAERRAREAFKKNPDVN